MDKMTLKELVKAVEGVILKEGTETEYYSLSTDSRSIEKNSIFVALKGANFNGNFFAGEASMKGARACIVDESSVDLKKVHSDAFLIRVQDCRRALLQLAKYYLSTLKLKVVGITGSTGKTSTKDLLAAALSSKYKVFKTKGNFNNEIGLPLMIFKLNKHYDIAVLEMGMSGFGEIHNLADTARPDIAIITNIGVSHLEHLKTRENILKAKLEIIDFFNSNNTLIINNDNDLLSGMDTKEFELIKTGFKDKNIDFYVSDYETDANGISFTVKERMETEAFKFHINIVGKHNISNSLLAIACGRKLGLSFSEIQEGFKNIEATSMRLDIIKNNNFTIIDDCYNASPDSMKAAIDVLSDIKGGRKIAVLGTMKELGEDAYNMHYEIGAYAKLKNIDMLICMGEYVYAYASGFSNSESFADFSQNEEINNYLNKNILQGDCVLVKASRSMKFENIVSNLKRINC